MQLNPSEKKEAATYRKPLSVLLPFDLQSCIQVSSPAAVPTIFHNPTTKLKLQAYKVHVLKSVLQDYLQTSEWRSKTQFPIVRTSHVIVRGTVSNTTELMELDVFNQYCVVRLAHLYNIKIGQALYLLKESMLGFQWLTNRFGFFQVNESNILINEKGLCKVWINQNLALNCCLPCNETQEKMVNSIIKKIQIHCQESKNCKKLFQGLKNCKTFISAIKVVENFSKETKTFVSSRISLSSKSGTNTESPLKTATSRKIISPNKSKKIARFSMKPKQLTSMTNILINLQENTEIQSNRSQRKKYPPHPLAIKRFKSQDKLNLTHLKTSGQETSYSNAIQLNTSNEGFSPITPASPTLSPTNPQSFYKSRSRRWMQESSFMTSDDKSQCDRKKRNQKYELTLSGPYEVNTKSTAKSNKNQNLQTSFSKSLKSPCNKKVQSSQEQANESMQVTPPRSPYQMQDEQEQKVRIQHLANIFKNNGWNPIADQFFNSSPDELKQSFHQNTKQGYKKKDEEVYEFRLDKIGNVGRRQISMSILPEQYQDVF